MSGHATFYGAETIQWGYLMGGTRAQKGWHVDICISK